MYLRLGKVQSSKFNGNWTESATLSHDKFWIVDIHFLARWRRKVEALQFFFIALLYPAHCNKSLYFKYCLERKDMDQERNSKMIFMKSREQLSTSINGAGWGELGMSLRPQPSSTGRRHHHLARAMFCRSRLAAALACGGGGACQAKDSLLLPTTNHNTQRIFLFRTTKCILVALT